MAIATAELSDAASITGRVPAVVSTFTGLPPIRVVMFQRTERTVAESGGLERVTLRFVSRVEDSPKKAVCSLLSGRS